MSKDCLRVSLLDVIRCHGLAKGNNENPELVESLASLFVEATGTEICIQKNSEEARCFLKYNRVLEYQSNITLESISLAFCRLYFGKNNKELLKRIEKYYREFCENIKHGDINTDLKQQIIMDEEAFQLIQQFSNFDDYEKEMSSKISKIKDFEKTKSKPEIKGKAIVE